MSSSQSQKQVDFDLRRKNCEQANAIVKLEGWEPSSAYLARQERYIQGEISSDELLKEVLAQAKARAMAEKIKTKPLEK